jgi:quercetin dioxygenase-like cupin family protein
MMSSLDRSPRREVLGFDLDQERARLNDPVLLERTGRNALTLVKNGPLRVVLIMVRPGGKIAPHRAAGPITAQVLDGDIRFRAAGQDHRLGTGDLLVLDAGVEHDVNSDAGGTFLLTMVQPAQTRGDEINPAVG